MVLKPWREVVTPHPDVAEGRYHNAEFAVNLAEVVAGIADTEYQDPIEFFERTYLTDGMGQLLTSAVERLAGNGGEPIIQLKTAFGGGKTHSMLALYHLLSGKVTPDQMEGVEHILSEAQVSEVPDARIAVIVGTDLNPTVTRDVNGVNVRTLWGDIAAQLGGQEGYAIVKEADEKSVGPGANHLTTLLNQFGPAVILIDELVAYARNIYVDNDLPAGTFDSNLTFVQSLTEAVKRSDRSQLIASIPESDIEIGGDAGQAALVRIEAIVGRLENIWRPVGANEGFEIVRRRLFSQVKDTAARDAVCRAFIKLYDDNPSDFPSECRETTYLDRLRQAYPIHPELFDRLYDDWSPLDTFQKTRGVLRLMAAVIHHLWANNDRSGLILSGSIPLNERNVREELLRYLADGWNAVVDKDVDGPNSETRAIDAGNTRFGKHAAAQNVARAIFMGSAPHASDQNVRGIEEIRINLGVAHPDESVSVFIDAKKHMENRLTHLYSRAQRYWYDTHPNLRRTMEDRAAKLEPEKVEADFIRRLRQIRDRGDFKAVHICPTSIDVPDELETRLVILSPASGHKTRQQNSDAIRAAAEILNKRGDSPRTYSNMLIFVAIDDGEGESLDKETRRYIAWDSIAQDAEALNLDANQRREASEGKNQCNETVGMRLNDAYRWLLVPTQEGTAPVEWEIVRISGAEENPVTKAVKKVRSDEQLITKWSPALLQMELDRWLWKEDEPHVSLKHVWDCLATYLYMPRLRDSGVLLDTVREGLKTTEWFGYADSVGDDGKYKGLQFGRVSSSVYINEASVLIKPDVAAAQLAEEQATDESRDEQDLKETDTGQRDQGSTDSKGETEDETGTDTDQSMPPKRFYGTVTLDPIRAARDAQQVIDEVVQHLTSLTGAKVEITMDIQANVPDGVPENVVVIVSENCKTLKFTAQGFEEE